MSTSFTNISPQYKYKPQILAHNQLKAFVVLLHRSETTSQSLFSCASPPTPMTSGVHWRADETGGQTGKPKIPTKHCLSSSKHCYFRAYEQYRFFTGFSKPCMNRPTQDNRIHQQHSSPILPHPWAWWERIWWWLWWRSQKDDDFDKDDDDCGDGTNSPSEEARLQVVHDGGGQDLCVGDVSKM
jgi:hypothetical protein